MSKLKMDCGCRKLSLFFLYVSVGWRCSGLRLSPHFLQFWNDVACRQNPLEGLSIMKSFNSERSENISARFQTTVS